MSEGPSTANGWQVRHLNDPNFQGGPYSWEQLVAFVRENRLAPLDPVWHQTLPGWVPAQQIPGLFGPAAAPQPQYVAPQPAPVQPQYVAPQPAPQPQYAPPQQQQYVPQQQYAAPAAAPKKKRGGLIALVSVLLVLLIGGGAFAGWWFFLRDGGGAGGTEDLGVADTKLPDRASLIETAEWGEVPANQICVMMAEGSRRGDAEKVAEAVGGTIVGEVEFVSLYQIEYAGTTEADLATALQTAEAAEGVDFAFPNQQVYLDAEIWGKRIDPYEDPFYGGGAGDGYRAIGVSKAWSYIKGSGIDLGNVKVGVTDDGLYMPGDGAENEFEGSGVNIDFPDPDAGENANPEVWDDGVVNPAGSHGTGVSTIIAGDPANGGPAGVAGPLGGKLTVSMINIFSAKYGDSETTPDPNDPTKYVRANGKTYSDGSLVALTKQVANGAKVINCSWGSSNASTATVAAYNRFFTKMAAEHPDVVFVCSGGNGGNVMNGARRIPSGLKLPNMITVGALNPDGTTADYADKASNNYEITLGAPGTGAVVGTKPGGGPEQQDGSSFAAPQVTAAVAILMSINPKLTAADIKRILTETARPGVPNTSGDPNATSKLVNTSEMGAGVLALDEAVLKVINDMRTAKGLEPLTAELLEKMGVVDAVAITGNPGEYTVRGIVEAAGEKGVSLKIEVFGENSAIGGKTEQSLDGAGEVEWSVTLPEDEGTIKVTRLDNGAASVIDVERIDINGTWTGTYTFTDITVTDEEAAEEEGCSLAIAEALIGKPIPMTLECTVDEGGNGSGVLTLDAEAISEDASSDPKTVGISYSGTTVTFEMEGASNMTATVSRSGQTLTMKGTLGGTGPGYTWSAAFTVSKPDETQ